MTIIDSVRPLLCAMVAADRADNASVVEVAVEMTELILELLERV